MKKFSLLFVSTVMIITALHSNATYAIPFYFYVQTFNFSDGHPELNFRILYDIDDYELEFDWSDPNNPERVKDYLPMLFLYGEYTDREGNVSPMGYKIPGYATLSPEMEFNEYTGEYYIAWGAGCFSISFGDIGLNIYDDDGSWPLYCIANEIEVFNGGDNMYGSYQQTFFDGVEFSLTAAPVPEPTTVLLIGSGIVGLVGFRRKHKKA